MKKICLLLINLLLLVCICACQSAANFNSPSLWKLDYYVDNFEEATSQKYIRSILNGTFNNPFTNNSNLTVKLIVDDFDISFELYEYGKYKVKNSSNKNYDEYKIVLRNKDGDEYDLKGYMYASSSRLYIDAYDKDIFLEQLNKKNDFKVYILNLKRQTINYLFSVNISGNYSNFEELYKEFKSSTDEVELTNKEVSLTGLWELIDSEIINNSEIEKTPNEYYEKSFLLLNNNKTFELRFENILIAGNWEITEHNNLKFIPFTGSKDFYLGQYDRNEIHFLLDNTDNKMFTLTFVKFDDK